MRSSFSMAIAAGFLGAALASFAGPGDFDPTFGVRGMARMGVGPSGDHAGAIKIHADGRFVVAGNAENGAQSDVVLSRYMADGSLDATFGLGGHAIIRPGTGRASGSDLLIDASGRYVVAGSAQVGNVDFSMLARFTSSGALDASFGNEGVVLLDWGGNALARGITFQTDGKIVAVGYAYNGTRYDFAVSRHNTDGSLDSTFDGDGRKMFAVSAYVNGDLASCTRIQSDGKILIAGYGEGNATAEQFAAVRLLADGSFDNTYGTSGISLNTAGNAFDCELQADGKFVMGGYRFASGFPNLDFDFKIARLNTDGSLDDDFGCSAPPCGGAVQISGIAPGSTNDVSTSLSIRGDGKILVSGYTEVTDGKESFAALMLNANGTFDATWGNAGTRVVTITPGDDLSYASALLADGSVLMVGSSGADIAIAKLTSAGAVDTAFNTVGYRTYDLANGAEGGFSDVKLQSDGKPVATLANHFGLVRLTSSGSRDATFGTNGAALVSAPSPASSYRLAIQGDGKIVTAGGTTTPGSLQAMVTRHLSNGALDTTFNSTGILVFLTAARADDVAIQPDGKIVVAGSVGLDGFVARLLADGTLDGAFGSSGVVTFAGATDMTSLVAVTVMGDGRIVAGGTRDGDFYAVRLSASGGLDATFGTAGQAVMDVDAGSFDVLFRLALQTDGKIVMVGTTGEDSNQSAAVVRLAADGSIDAGFGAGGVATTLLPGLGVVTLSGLAIQPDGKVLVAGWYEKYNPPSIAPKIGQFDPRGLLARVNPNGIVDGSLPGCLNNLGANGGRFRSIALQGDGKIVSAGEVYGEREGQAFVARMLGGTGLAAPVRRDFNSDDKSDILFRHADGTNYVWHVNGASISGGLVAIDSQGLLPSMDPSWAVVGMGDFNGDGKADVLWRNASGQNYVWLVDGSTISNSTLTIIGQGLLPSVDTAWAVAGIGDFNGDGKSDIFWRRNSDGFNHVWHVDASVSTGGLFSIPSQGVLPSVDGTWIVAGIGDFDGDCKAGILWRHNDGYNYVWNVDGGVIQNGVVSITTQGLLPTVDLGWVVVGTGDYNGDGKSDVFWRRNSDGTNHVWHVDAAQISDSLVSIVSQGLLPQVDLSWTVVGKGDYNGDSRSDVLWRRNDGTNYVWHVDGAVISGSVLSITSQGLLPSVDTNWTIVNTK